jgi:hypothetical protein
MATCLSPLKIEHWNIEPGETLWLLPSQIVELKNKLLDYALVGRPTAYTLKFETDDETSRTLKVL